MTAVVPEIAVVIPTRGRETRLAFALEALAAQTLDCDRFEVLVVRDGDWAGKKASAPDGINIRFLALPERRGPAAARNHGWRASSAPMVAFLDDDCRPAPEWLEGVLEAADGEEAIVQGRTEPDPDEAHLLFGLARSQEITGPSGWYQSCNIAYRRSLLAHLHGFDERFPGPAGEDTDLGIRARAAGAKRVYARTALIWHAVHARPLPAALREAARWDVVPILIARYPSQREHIYWRYFWKESHAALLALLLGLVMLRRSKALGALATIPYLALRVDRSLLSPRGALGQAVHLPSRLALDATELAITVRGALKHRVLVL